MQTYLVPYIASFFIGVVVAIIAAAIFAIILHRVERSDPKEVVRELRSLIYLILGGGLADFVVFDIFINTGGAIFYYLAGFALAFIPLGLWIFFEWRK